MKKKLMNLYLHLTVKTPIMSMGAIVLFAVTFLLLTSHTFVGQYEVQQADYSPSVILTNHNPRIKSGEEIYFYQDKNERVYKLIVKDIEVIQNKMNLTVEAASPGDVLSGTPGLSGYIEVLSQKSSILSQILKGSKNGS